jgi:HD-GYP domain-containing protein (c-di-GMP phosphodiesterase class II)
MRYQDLSVKLDDMINMIIITLDARDPYTYSHSERVAALSVLIAAEMKLPQDEIDKIHIAAHLHDIGKIGVADIVLNKEGKLSKEELIQMQSHSLIGYNILNKIDLFKEIEILVLHHHERFDGEGYPSNLKGENIPIESRIIAVADSFDAITSDRSYRKGSSYEVGFEELNNHIGDQFCPTVVRYFNQANEGVAPLLDTIEKVNIHHTAFVGHEDLIHSRRIVG